MEGTVISILILFIFIVWIIIVVVFNNQDSKLNKKRFYNKVRDIKYNCGRLNIKEINVENKGVLFRVKVDDGERVEKVGYESPYKAINIYINEELVCKVHILKNAFTMEYTQERNRREIDEIITKAYKISEKKFEECCKTKYKVNSNSFYNN